jgi:dCMP deaminase
MNKVAMSKSKWDDRFLTLAQLVGSWSKDPSTQCGAVIVRPNRSVASVGFNGFPQDMEDRPEWYAEREEKYIRVVHAEVNALLFSREPVAGYTLYTYPIACCPRCAVQMIQSGISRFVFPVVPVDKRDRWTEQIEKTKSMFTDIGIPFCEVTQ